MTQRAQTEPTTTIALLRQNGVPWSRLSTTSMDTIELIAGPLAQGATQKQIARVGGCTEDAVAARLAALRKELTELTLAESNWTS